MHAAGPHAARAMRPRRHAPFALGPCTAHSAHAQCLPAAFPLITVPPAYLERFPPPGPFTGQASPQQSNRQNQSCRGVRPRGPPCLRPPSLHSGPFTGKHGLRQAHVHIRVGRLCGPRISPCLPPPSPPCQGYLLGERCLHQVHIRARDAASAGAVGQPLPQPLRAHTQGIITGYGECRFWGAHFWVQASSLRRAWCARLPLRWGAWALPPL